MKKSFLVLPCAFLAAASLLSAQQAFYVGKSGNDSYNGSYYTPYLTINAAVSAASAGDTINVLEGVYKERISLNKELRLEGFPNAILEFKPKWGSPDFCIEINASQGNLGSGLVVTGFEFQGLKEAAGVWVHNDSTSTAAFDVSPIIQNNTFIDCTWGVALDCFAGSSSMEARFNHITNTDEDTEPNAFGIIFRSLGGDITASTHSNQIEKMEIGIGLFDYSGSVQSMHQNDAIQFCEWGVMASGPNAHGDLVHETVAHGRTASKDPYFPLPTWGVFADDFATLNVYNSIIWIPNWTGPDDMGGFFVHPGIDVNDPSLITVDNYTTVQDYPGSQDPLFVYVDAFDLRLQAASPAIDAADLTIMQPAHALSTPYDNDWNPRVLDSDITNGNPNMLPDRGAYEFTQVDLDIRSTAYANYSPSGQPYPQLRFWDPTAGQNQLHFDVKGPVGSIYFIWLQANISGQQNNLSFNALGNLQLAPVGAAFFSGAITDPSGVATHTIPVYLPGFVEADFEAQAVVLTSLVPDNYEGAFTRRIEMEIDN